MTEIMTPSRTTTAGQIDKAVANYRALLEKHSKEFGSEAVQEALGQPELAGEQFAIFRRRVEAFSNLITRRVPVNRSRTPQEALAATGCKPYADPMVVDNMPKGDLSGQEGDEVEVIFFKPQPEEYTRPGFMSDDDLEQAFGRRSFKSADPYSVAAVNEADPTFADKHPHGTRWKDSDNKWCYATFNRWGDERGVSVSRNGLGWGGSWWFAGVRLPAGKAGE